MGAKGLPKVDHNGAQMKKAPPKGPFAEQERESEKNKCEKDANVSLQAVVSLTKVRRNILRIHGTAIHGKLENKGTKTRVQKWDRKNNE